MREIFIMLFAISTFISCTSIEAPETQMTRPDGTLAEYEELSAGLSTIFNATKFAFDTPSDWVTGDLYNRFMAGDALYDTDRIPEMNDFALGGLGPVYCGFSCGSCHNNTGSTGTTLWDKDGGSGKHGFTSALIFITRKDGGYLRNYGRVLHDQGAIWGVKPEGKLKVRYTYQKYKFHDGEEYELATPHYSITEWYADSLAAEDLVVSVRTPMRHVGQGAMMALDKEQLLRLEKQSNYPEYGISGRLNYVVERGVRQIGLSGRKAQHVDLTIELGFSSDMGTTNDRYPEESCEGQLQYNQTYPKGNHGIQISSSEMEDVDLYLHSTGVPARRNVNDPEVIRGQKLFQEAKCHLCHIPTLNTTTQRVKLINGTELPWLSGQVIHPYSDYLLHDMGHEMQDEYPSGLASGHEWKTTPLWGIGLIPLVNGHSQFMHDGRARNLTEAIMWHYGEGAVSKELFARMPKTDRDAVIKFIETL